MTELVDEITVKISMYPDRADVRYSTDINKMRQWARDNLGNLGPLACQTCQAGTISIFGGGIEVTFSNTGLQEIPEETGGDN